MSRPVRAPGAPPTVPSRRLGAAGPGIAAAVLALSTAATTQAALSRPARAQDRTREQFDAHVYLPVAFRQFPDEGGGPTPPASPTASAPPTASATPGASATATAPPTAEPGGTATASATAGASATPGASATATASPSPTVQLVVTFLDVGQADAIWVHTSDGWDALVDGGNRGAGAGILDRLDRSGVDDLDAVIATHPHADHIGGLADVVRGIDVREYVHTGRGCTTGVCNDLATAVAARAVPTAIAMAGDAWRWGGAEALVLHPVDQHWSDPNDGSIVIRLALGVRAYLLAGDAGTGAESEMMGRPRPLRADVLKVAHHGSKTASSPGFLQAVAPSVAVVSVGRPNQYGLPDEIVLERLMQLGAATYQTADVGDVTVSTDGSSLDVTTDP